MKTFVFRSSSAVMVCLAMGLGEPVQGQPGEGHGEHTGPEEAWRRQVAPRLRKNPAFAYVEDVPGLPRVLLIGDSISIGYTAPVREALKGKANVHRVPTNAGDTARGLEQLDAWLGDTRWDVIHVNFGLHDLKRMRDGKLDNDGEQVRAVDDYRANLEQLAERLKATGAVIIWASTTPVPEGSQGRVTGDEVRYNEVARTVMAAHGIAVNDLYSAVLPQLDTYQRPQNVHFTPEGSEFLGRKVAEAILAALK